jgi:hypothetical protein
MFLKATLLHTSLLLPSVAISSTLYLGCIGTNSRDEGRGETISRTHAIQVKIDLESSTIQVDGLSCWAGRGDCTKLRMTTSDTQIRANGDGKLAGTGFFTTLELDRRSGFMRFSQQFDRFSGINPGPGPKSEASEYICQGGAKPIF